MAKISFSGLETFSLSLQELAAIPEDVKDEMLSSGADVAIRAMRQSLDSYGLVESGQLKGSLDKKRKTDKQGELYYDVAPYGKRDDGERNGQVGYVNEYGAPHKGIRARPWMQLAVETAADDIAAAEAAVYDKWLESKNL